MNFQGKKLIAVFILLTLFAAWGCAPEKRGYQEEQKVMFAMDQHRYQDAIRLLEAEYPKSNSKDRVEFLLAQANLGMAGVEFTKVFADLEHLQELKLEKQDLEKIPYNIFHADLSDPFQVSKCRDMGNTKASQFDLKCIPLVLYERFPDPDQYWVRKAREWLGSRHQVARAATREINFLMGVVDSASALNRLKTVLHTEADIHSLKHMVLELLNSFKRFLFSYPPLHQTVSKVLSQYSISLDDPYFQGSIESDLKNFLNLMRKQAEKIYQDAEIPKEFNPEQLPALLRKIDDQVFGRSIQEELVRIYHLANLHQKIRSFADSLKNEKKPKVSLSVIFKMRTPHFFNRFIKAMEDTWDHEDTLYLKRAAILEKNEWEVLVLLEQEWSTWFQSLPDATRDEVNQVIARNSKKETGDLEFLHRPYLLALTELETITRPNDQKIHALIEKTRSWIRTNLYSDEDLGRITNR